MTTRTTNQQSIEQEGFLERLGKRLDNASKWHKRLLAVGAIIATVSGAVVAISNNINTTLDAHIGEQLADVASYVESSTKSLQEIRLDTLRTQLLLYMYHEPYEHNTILEIARVYFVEYKGDWIMTNKFKQWAKDEGVEVPFELNH